MVLLPSTAHAVQLVPCSENALVNAINAANLVGGDDLVLSPFCTYTLTTAHGTGVNGPSGLPPITTPIRLTGLGTDIARDPSAPAFRIAEVRGPGVFPATAGSLTLNAVTLRGGEGAAEEVGGGIGNFGGAVVLDASTLRNNSAEDGGGLYNDTGSATLIGSTVVGNIATDANGGGGIYDNSGPVTLIASFVRGNSPDNCAPSGSIPFCTV
ncbi:hypothetical protein ITX44_37730 [Streptomyces sp. KK5PA1]|uniref:Polymorphic outer membrane protein n=1 Tax=Actinacidiphila acididurans TaxID=2784346 RepID=A0ABS2U5B6_9ACTN|nr:hypothetical protein [Actinacidiphila acididurans]